MQSRERVLTALDHHEPDRIPLFRPNLMNTRSPYDQQVTAFLESFAFDELASLPAAASYPSERGRLPRPLSTAMAAATNTGAWVCPTACTRRWPSAETVADVEAFDWPDPDARG